MRGRRFPIRNDVNTVQTYMETCDMELKEFSSLHGVAPWSNLRRSSLFSSLASGHLHLEVELL